MSNSERIQRERELFSLCLEHSQEEWDTMLADYAGNDQTLHDRVRRLLDKHLATATLNTALALVADDPERIGPYRILQRLGEGGMGIVYAAEQREPVRRRVALKVLRVGHNSREVLARFDLERQALALMNHPHIAHILDAGTTTDHRPFIVMEFVAGEPITRYCRQRRMPLRERLQLFRSVCDAVQHAHQRGIIHRDLKPTNILVAEEDGKPIPKIIDFGIAKAVTQRLTEHTLETKVGSLLGTPDYMSPEQADLSPLDVDTRSDIYSLGAVLYELLTGTVPLQLAGSGKTFTEMQSILAEQVPPPPSQRLEGSERRPLRGELDWITLKALEKQRSRRYSSASELAQDIDNHLAGLPITAGRPSRARKAAKFLRRHWLATASVTTVLLTLAISQFQLLENNRQLELERDRATAAATESEQVTNVLAEIFSAVDPDERGGETLTVPILLQKGFERVRQDASFTASVRSRLLTVIGKAFLSQGDFARAAAAYESAIDAGGIDQQNADAFIVMQVRLAASLQESGDITAARTVLEQAASLLEEYGLEDSDSGTAVRNATALHHLFLHDSERAVELLNAVLEEYMARYGPHHERTLSTRHNLALALTRTGETAVARRELERVIEAAAAAFDEDHTLVADASLLLGNVLRRDGDIEAARGHYLRAWQLLSRLHGPESGSALNAQMGFALAHRGEPRGIELLEDILGKARTGFGEDSILTLATSANLADFLLDSGRHHEALPHAQMAYTGIRRIFGNEHANTWETAYTFATAAAGVERHEEAIEALEIALKDPRYITRFPEDPRFAGVADNTAYARLRQKARTLAEQSVTE